jgi:heat shock protein HtpX
MNFYEQQSKNKKMTLVLFVLFAIIVLAIIWIANSLFGIYYGAGMPSIFLGIIIIIGLISGVAMYAEAGNIAIIVSGAKLADEKNFKQFHNIADEMAIASGLPKPKLYFIEDTAINAFAAGTKPENSIICFTTGALQKLNREEIQGVMGHEMSHIRNLDIRTMTVAAIMVGFVILLSDFILRSLFWGGRSNSNNDTKNGGAIIIIILAVLAAIAAPIIAQMIKATISRKREFLADASSAELTRNPEGLAKALEKISKDNEPLEAANRATAHMYISNPLKGADNLLNLFSTHPPIKERINILRGIQN